MWDRARLDRSLEKYQEGSRSEIKCIYVHYVVSGRGGGGATGDGGDALRADDAKRAGG